MQTGKTEINYGNRPPENEGWLARFFARLAEGSRHTTLPSSGVTKGARLKYKLIYWLLVVGGVMLWLRFVPIQTLHAAVLIAAVGGTLGLFLFSLVCSIAERKGCGPRDKIDRVMWAGLCILYVAGAFVLLNRMLDYAPGEPLLLPITGKYTERDIKHGREDLRPYLSFVLRVPGKSALSYVDEIDGREERLLVSQADYVAAQVGETKVNILLFPGAFGMGWYNFPLLVPRGGGA